MVRIEVKVKPRAKTSRILGFTAEGAPRLRGVGSAAREGVLEVALAAPPADGAANAELVRLLARELGVPQRSVVIVRGASSRMKLVEVDGITDLRKLM